MSAKNAIAKIGQDIVLHLDGAGIGHLLTVEETAGVLRCSVSSLNKWRLTGRGPPFVHVESRVRYRTSDLNTYIAGRTVTSTSAEISAAAASSRPPLVQVSRSRRVADPERDATAASASADPLNSLRADGLARLRRDRSRNLKIERFKL